MEEMVGGANMLPRVRSRKHRGVLDGEAIEVYRLLLSDNRKSERGWGEAVSEVGREAEEPRRSDGDFQIRCGWKCRYGRMQQCNPARRARAEGL